MYSLKRLILIDSYKPGELVELRLDGHTNLNGVNGAGKTTLLRLVPLFFGERPGRLVPKSRVTDSFAKHYLPNESSYIIFEYQRFEQTCMAIMYASTQDDSLCYRFADKGFAREDFIETRSDGSFYPVSCRNLRTHFLKRRIAHSEQLTACNDYRTVIQNLPHKKGQELRQLVARYSFCNSSLGHRLKDIEKIVTGMLTRSTDFADLRDMLVNCIEENRDSISLDLQMETLDSWHKEYRAYQNTEAERGKIEQLNQLENDFAQIELGLGEVQYRLRCLLSQNEQQLQQTQDNGSRYQQQLEQLKTTWDIREQQLKSALAESKAALEQAQRQFGQLNQEKVDWDKQDVPLLSQLLARLPHIKARLQQEQANLQQLMADVQDIEAKFKQLKAEKENYFSGQQHGYELAIRDAASQASELKSQAQAHTEQQKEARRESHSKQLEHLQTEQLKLREARGILTSQIADIQPDPALIANREARQEAYHANQQLKQEAEKVVKELEANSKKNQLDIDRVLADKAKQVQERQRLQDDLAHLQNQLDANPDSLLGFLREHQPQWTGHIAKVINPELLLREDLEPVLHSGTASFYGVSLNLDNLVADHAADENRIRALLQVGQNQLHDLAIADAKHDSQLETLRKSAEALKKQAKAADLTVGQLQAQLNKLTEELHALKQQIERSKRDRAASLEVDKNALEEQIKLSNSQLQALKQGLQTELAQLSQALAEQLQQIDVDSRLEKQKIQQLIDQLQQQQHSELAQLEHQRLQSLHDRKVDTATLQALEASIGQLQAEEESAEDARHIVNDYQRWLAHEWSRHDSLSSQAQRHKTDIQQQQNQYHTEQSHNQQQRHTLNEALARLKTKLDKINKDMAMIHRLLADLALYSHHKPEQPRFDEAHTLALLQADCRKLTEQHKSLRNQLATLLRQLKKVLAHSPDTHPGRYYSRVEDELGFDSDDLAWLARIQAWYSSEADTARSWLMSQARLFGSTLRNYKEALARFDRGIDSLSRRLAANIDSNIRFEKIERIEGRLTSKVTTLGYWDQIVRFTKDYDDWSRINDGQLPSQDFADLVKQIAEQLHSKSRVEMKLVNLLELEIMVTENGRTKRATHAEELRQISSHGLSYLILCVFFIALVNMIRKNQPVNIIWPMDELKELHQMNIEMLVDILTQNQITLFSAFPDPDPDVLRLFANRYQVYGFRELIEMSVDDDYLAGLAPLPLEASDV